MGRKANKKVEKRVSKANRIIQLTKAIEIRRLIKLGLRENGDDDDFKTPNGDPWESCQVDVNKLVQPQKVSEASCDLQMGLPKIEMAEECIPEDVKPVIDASCVGASVGPVLEIHTLEKTELHSCTAQSVPLSSVVEESECLGCLGLLQQSKQLRQSHADMLRECFSLEVECATLCMACFTRLSDAQCFKRDVLSNSQRFEVRLKEEVMSETDAVMEVKIEKVAASETQACKPVSKQDNDKPVKRKRKPKLNKWAIDNNYSGSANNKTCKKCNEIVAPENMISHYEFYHKDFRFPCSICAKRFGTTHLLRQHKIDEHDVDERKCNACDVTFTTRRQCRAHMMNFHKLGERLQCAECDYECYMKLFMKRHMKNHEATRDYQCKFCKKAFKRSTHLRTHERIHTADKRKVCSKCGQAFVQKASLNYHMAKYHPAVKF